MSAPSRWRSFSLVAESYDWVRPTYPDDSLLWALGAGPLDVIDVGADTGKLTEVALRLGHRVTAARKAIAELRRVSRRRVSWRSFGTSETTMPLGAEVLGCAGGAGNTAGRYAHAASGLRR